MGRDSRMTFTGTVGTRYNVGIGAVGAPTATVSLLNTDGSVLASVDVGNTGAPVRDLDIEPLSATGTYTVLIDPAKGLTGTYGITLSTPTDASIAINGADSVQNITRRGQDYRLTFTGVAGTAYQVGINAIGAPAANVSVLRPHGTVVSNTLTTGGLNDIDLAPLSVAGGYTIVVNPLNGAVGRYTFTLSSAISQALSLNASALHFARRLKRERHLGSAEIALQSAELKLVMCDQA